MNIEIACHHSEQLIFSFPVLFDYSFSHFFFSSFHPPNKKWGHTDEFNKSSRNRQATIFAITKETVKKIPTKDIKKGTKSKWKKEVKQEQMMTLRTVKIPAKNTFDFIFLRMLCTAFIRFPMSACHTFTFFYGQRSLCCRRSVDIAYAIISLNTL